MFAVDTAMGSNLPTPAGAMQFSAEEDTKAVVTHDVCPIRMEGGPDGVDTNEDPKSETLKPPFVTPLGG